MRPSPKDGVSLLVPKKLHGPSKAHLVPPFHPHSRVNGTWRNVPVPCLQGQGFPLVGTEVPLFPKLGRFGRHQNHAYSCLESWEGLRAEICV